MRTVIQPNKVYKINQNNMEPTKEDFEDPMFEAIWQTIKNWDIQREPGSGYAGATGTDVKTILEAIQAIQN